MGISWALLQGLMWWSCDCHVTSSSCFPAASVVLTLANLEGEETFDSSLLGQADEVVQERVCDDELILVKGYGGGATPEGWVGQLCDSHAIPSEEAAGGVVNAVRDSAVWSCTLPSPVQSPVQQPRSSSGEPTTSWWTRWSAQCMTPSVW